MKVEYINPFLMAAKTVLQQIANIETTVGKLYVKKTEYDDNSILILIGVTGNIVGQVILAFKIEDALKIAEAMCGGMQFDQLNEISESAVCELGNMILGNAMTILSTNKIICDITSPSVCLGKGSIENLGVENVCIPLQFDGGRTLELNVSLQEK